ncbi:unnamed protein product [Adineta steineri]|uniref:DED domain-containing protein n=1 Tax=Adineta steineri TaxID=433720 RepID=A0A819JNU4_9BILA|nr:unnamed protein product [Adineta steineri]CAF1139539.1 unnamed protein product [Adineta steineri]CAF3936047.1 unnamed protein product [Adineta steineri]CAF4050913.1 unnamed protein product [Adineta steineri]
MDCSCSGYNLAMDDNSHLRRIILTIENRLSNDDRERLHFFFGDDIPRRIRDDPTLRGTLNLMQSLFDRDIISGNDFTKLITAFEAIQCFDIVNILKKHQQQIELTHAHQSMHSLTSIMPPLSSLAKEVIDDLDSAHPIGTRLSVSESGIYNIVPLPEPDNYNIVHMPESGNYNTVPLREPGKPLVKPGIEHGSARGTYFDHSSNPNFASSHYLNGINAYNDDDESYEFLYSSFDKTDLIMLANNESQSLDHRGHFSVEKNYKIQRVEGYYLNKTVVFPNGTILTIPIVTGIQFFTTNGHASPLYTGEEGKRFSEEYEGYTLWYATGRSDLYIHQLQFFWRRTPVTH